MTLNREYMVEEYLTIVTDRKINKNADNVQTEWTQSDHRNRLSLVTGYPGRPNCVHFTIKERYRLNLTFYCTVKNVRI